MKIKYSFYNELIFVTEANVFLLYNILSGSLIVLEYELGTEIREISSKNWIIVNEYPKIQNDLEELIDTGFLVDFDIDEKERYQVDTFYKQSVKYKNNSHIGLTIGTTILCNMGCPYCFEVVKPNKTLKDESVINAIATFIEKMITEAPVSKWESFSVTWYGGEPLINKDPIEKLTKKFIEITDKYEIPYSASIITNGILLDKETWLFLVRNKVTNAQITIDGSKETHNEYRPLKNSISKNYEKILENLSIMPLEMKATIRINTDKKVAETFNDLLHDLQSYGVWPQRHTSVELHLAWLRSYKDTDTSNMVHMNQEEFFEAQYTFSKLQIQKFNFWGQKNGVEKGKMKWRIPEKQSDCATWVSPYFFTIDPDGYLHKCWETVHDSKKSSGIKVFENWNANDYKDYTSYSRTTVHPTCYNCKYNPVCEGLSCAYEALATIPENEFPCTPWKTQLPSYFTKMYNLMQENPNDVVIEQISESVNQTHSNK